MERIDIPGLMDAHQQDLPLDPSTYEVVIVNPQVREREGKAPQLMVPMSVVDGPEQSSGSSPLERRITDFFPLGGYENMKDGGEFVKRKLSNLLTAAGVDFDDDGFDPDDLGDKHVLVKTTIREPDEYNSEASTEVRRYMKA
jgi:hypothetical protein